MIMAGFTLSGFSLETGLLIAGPTFIGYLSGVRWELT